MDFTAGTRQLQTLAALDYWRSEAQLATVRGGTWKYVA